MFKYKKIEKYGEKRRLNTKSRLRILLVLQRMNEISLELTDRLQCCSAGLASSFDCVLKIKKKHLKRCKLYSNEEVIKSVVQD